MLLILARNCVWQEGLKGVQDSAHCSSFANSVGVFFAWICIELPWNVWLIARRA